MRIVFNRNTHDKDNKYRGEEYFGIPQYITRPDSMSFEEHDKHCDKISKERSDFDKQQLFFGPHTLTKHDMTLEEIFKETQSMLYGGALDGKFDPQDERLSIAGHLKALAFMIEHKLITAEIRVA